MKKVLCCGILLAFGIVSSNAQDLKNLTRIDVNGFYSNPIASPNGEYALVTGEHAAGVYLIHLKTNTIQMITDKEGCGYGYSWNSLGNEFYFKQKGKHEYFSSAKTFSYNIDSKRMVELQEIHHNYLPSFKGMDQKDASRVVVYTNTTTLKVHAKDLVSQKDWIVTNDEGQFYNAILSHDATKIAVHNGPNIYIYDISGKQKPINLGMGIATAWDVTDKYLIGFLDESLDGHTIDNSEIYVFSPDQKAPVKLTNTEVFSEMFPSFAGENKIIFSDDKTGRLFTIDIK